LQLRIEFGRGLAHQLFEIEVEGIAAHTRGFLGQGIGGVHQQIALTDQVNGIIDSQHIDVLAKSNVNGIFEWIFQDSLHQCVPKSGIAHTKCAGL
jgi:hypothetical protein